MRFRSRGAPSAEGRPGEEKDPHQLWFLGMVIKGPWGNSPSESCRPEMCISWEETCGFWEGDVEISESRRSQALRCLCLKRERCRVFHCKQENPPTERLLGSSRQCDNCRRSCGASSALGCGCLSVRRSPGIPGDPQSNQGACLRGSQHKCTLVFQASFNW